MEIFEVEGTLVCTQRMGRQEACFCDSEDTMEEILRREKR